MANSRIFIALVLCLALRASASQVTASGADGVFTLPTAQGTPDGKLAFGLAGNYYRGDDFLLPATTSQRSGGALAATTGIAGVLEVYGALSLTSTNLFSVKSRQTLISGGDADLGVKLLLPAGGPWTAGLLLQADLPSGVGGVSFKALGGRGALMLGYATHGLELSALAGYRFDNTDQLYRGMPATLPAFALGFSAYDTAYGGLTLQAPLRYAVPGVELALETPVARQTALPEGDRPLRSRLAFGATEIHTGIPQLTFSAALQFSLSDAGRLSQRAIPVEGFAPDAPWTLLAGVTWALERPRLPDAPQWHEPVANAQPEVAPLPAPKPKKAALRVTVLDGRSRLPLVGAWISFVEGSDVGGTTGVDGKLRVETEAGNPTVAVAKDGYELLTKPVTLTPGNETYVTVELQPVAPDATLRGRLVAADGTPLRALVFVTIPGALPVAPADPQIFEGAYSLGVAHGRYELNVLTPGYRAPPETIEVRPGETITRDVTLSRFEGEGRVRLTSRGLDVAALLSFEGTDPAKAAQPLLAEMAAALKNQRAPLDVLVRIAQEETTDEAEALRLSDARAQALADALRSKGVKALLSPRGLGLAQKGQPLFEIRETPLVLPPRSELWRATSIASRGTP